MLHARLRIRTFGQNTLARATFEAIRSWRQVSLLEKSTTYTFNVVATCDLKCMGATESQSADNQLAAFAPVLEELFVENRGCARMLGKPYRAPLPLLERPPTTQPFSKLRVVDVVTLLGDVQSMHGHLAAAILHNAPVLESVRLPIRVPRERPPAVQPTTIYVTSPHLRKLHLSFEVPAPAGRSSPAVVVDVQSDACAALEDISLECMEHGFALECSNGCVKHGLASRPVPTAAVRLCAPLARARVVRELDLMRRAEERHVLVDPLRVPHVDELAEH